MASASATSLVPENVAWRSINGMAVVFGDLQELVRLSFIANHTRTVMAVNIPLAPASAGLRVS
jgi:hypothetical protein